MTPSTSRTIASRLTQSAGELLWSVDFGAPVKSSPTVVDGTVYVGSNDGLVHAVSTDGTEQWQFDAGDAVFAAPTVVDGTVFVGSRYGPGDDLYALDAASGEEIWGVEHLGWYVTASPGFHDGTILVGTNDGTLYGVAANTGDEQWSADLNGPMVTNPCIVDGTAYFGRTDNAVTAVDVASGDEHWTTSVATTPTSPTVADGTVFVGEGRAFEDDVSPAFVALDAASGEEIWSDERPEYVPAAPTSYEGDVYASFNIPLEADLRALRESNGEQQWSFDSLGYVNGAPTVAGRQLYFGDFSGRVYGLSLADGSEQWRFETDDVVDSAPIVVDGTLYVGSDDGKLYALDTGHGESSQDSRVRTATFGHHGSAWSDVSVDASPGDGTETGSESDGDGGGEEASGGDGDGSGAASDDSLPGPGILGTVTSIVGATYLLGRGTDEDEAE